MLQRIIDLFTRDPVDELPACRRIPLSLYLPYESLNNVALGDPYQKLTVFGRPSNRLPFKYDRFVYYPLGLIVEGESEKVEYFEFVARDHLQQHVACAVTMTGASGAKIEVNENTNLREVERILGAPTTKEQDEYETISSYRHDKLLLEFQYTADGMVTRFYVERSP